MSKKLLGLTLLLSLTLVFTGCGTANTSLPSSYSSGGAGVLEEKIDIGVGADSKINAEISAEPQVKKSSTGICHEIGSTYYNRTKNFTAYNSIEECLNSGGRLPKR